jgi:hypothetical protein
MTESASTAPENETAESDETDEERFTLDMTVGEAMKLHPKAQFGFASYHVGGGAHGAISEHETIEQVCYGYGIPPEDLLESLNSLLEDGEDPDLEAH